jgi:HEAT repeat protein
MTFRAKMPHAAMALLLMISVVRSGAVRAANSPDDVARLIQQLQDPDIQSRRDAVRGFGKISPLPPDALDALAKLLEREDQDPQVRGFANDAVCNAGAAAIPIATRFAQSKVQFTSYIGIEALGCLATKNEAARPVLIKMYKQNPSNVPRTAARVGAPMLPLLFDALHGGDPTMREAALSTLGQVAYDGRVIGKESLVKIHSGYIAPAELTAIKPNLAMALGDGNLKLRGAAAVALNYVDPSDPRVVPVFVDLAKEKDAPFRDYAIKALGDFGGVASAVVAPLEDILATNNEVLLQADAGEALAKIEGRAACAALEKAIARKQEAAGTAERYLSRNDRSEPPSTGTLGADQHQPSKGECFDGCQGTRI